jgi:hypothetical protein
MKSYTCKVNWAIALAYSLLQNRDCKQLMSHTTLPRNVGSLLPVRMLIALSLLSGFTIMAQETSINTDRPDQSDGVYCLPKNSIQIENGLQVAQHSYNNDFMLRYGVTHTTELRLIADAGKEWDAHGLKPISISVKQHLWDQKKGLPAVTAVGYLTVESLASKNFKGKGTSVVFLLAFESELSPSWFLGYNIGTTHDADELDISTSLSYSLSESVIVFAEYFGVFSPEKPEHGIDGGLLWAITPRFQIDIACGKQLSQPHDSFFTTVGAAIVFHKKQQQ